MRQPVIEVVDIRQDIGVGERNAFGAAGCTAGVDESQDRVRIVNWIATELDRSVQWLFIEHPLPRELDGRRRQRRVPDEAARVRVGKDAIDFDDREPGVYRNRDDPQPAAGIYQLEVLGSVREQESQPVSALKTMPAERRNDTGNTTMKLSKRRMPSARAKRGAFRIIASSPSQ